MEEAASAFSLSSSISTIPQETIHAFPARPGNQSEREDNPDLQSNASTTLIEMQLLQIFINQPFSPAGKRR
jgi:hypothetical protein